jgi:hypothetical protein
MFCNFHRASECASCSVLELWVLKMRNLFFQNLSLDLFSLLIFLNLFLSLIQT